MTTLERIDLDDLTILKLKGSLCAECLEEIGGEFEQVTHAPGAHVIVDLTHVEMVTTPAISMFIAAANAQGVGNGRIIFTESTPPVRDVLERLRLHGVLHTVTGLTEAIRRIRQEA